MYSKAHPYLSRIKERCLLTAPASSKKTFHFCLDSPLSYSIGDSVAILPYNDPEEVESILKYLGFDGEEEVLDTRSHLFLPIRTFLLEKANLFRVSGSFLKCLLERGAYRIEPLLQSNNKAHLLSFLHSHTLLEILLAYPQNGLLPADLAASLLPLLPRFYSIANSQRVFPKEIHLAVAYVHYELDGKKRIGVGSHFLCDLAAIETTPIPLYIQPSHAFSLPQDPAASIILVGPGTGIAPFRAFLQERIATQAPGRNWLFFGERNRATDFYYESFWTELEKQGRLRLDLAFSRDTPQKLYVQHKMYEERKSLWSWLQDGSFFYVSGNAEKMARDVDAMLHQIAREEGRMSEGDARLYIKKLRSEKRYLTDVY